MALHSLLSQNSNLHRLVQTLSLCTASISSLPQDPAEKTRLLIQSCSNFNHMKQIQSHMITNNIAHNSFSASKFIEISISSSKINFATILVTQLEDLLDTSLCNSIIRAYIQTNKHREALLFYTQMQATRIQLDDFTFAPLLKSCGQLSYLELGKSIHGRIIQMGFYFNVFTETALVHMYSTCRALDLARQLFDEMPERNSVSWNAMITGYVHNRRFSEALKLFQEMQANGFEASEVTVVSCLTACAHLGALNQGKWIHSFIKQNRLRLNMFVGTALIDMYGKCGVVDEAEKVFGAMTFKNVYCWNAMISGLAMNGRGKAALQLFSKMIMENFKPDDVTFLGVLCACCHQGLVEEGRKFLVSMNREFGLNQRIQHYGCMVDLLGRAGFLDEAQEVIRKMPMNPDSIIWRVLLGACRIHGNTQLGELVIGNLLDLEPSNGENYVLLANLYARDGKWNKVAEVREMMEIRGIKKVPGCSLIEIDNVVYEFVVADRSEPGLEEIFQMLADMNREMKLAGYVAETGMVSYDIDEEEKEGSLMYHSEKLALAFGLLRTPPGSAIRIVKNLRVCLDCHLSFKLASKIYRRDITVRDRNRFHHFSDGACSCGDYW